MAGTIVQPHAESAHLLWQACKLAWMQASSSSPSGKRRPLCAFPNSATASAMSEPTAPDTVKSPPPARAAKRAPFAFGAPKRAIAKKSWTRTGYFDARQKKLEAQAPAAETAILSGTTIYFTGVKSTSQRKLERLVWLNGGAVQKAWLRRRVTHVVADNLAASKVEKELTLDVRNAAVVVRPDWIFESLKSGARLPTWDFRVVKSPPGVRDVASYFKRRGGKAESTASKDCKQMSRGV